jgi:hypothetical protein
MEASPSVQQPLQYERFHSRSDLLLLIGPQRIRFDVSQDVLRLSSSV